MPAASCAASFYRLQTRIGYAPASTRALLGRPAASPRPGRPTVTPLEGVVFEQRIRAPARHRRSGHPRPGGLLAARRREGGERCAHLVEPPRADPADRPIPGQDLALAEADGASSYADALHGATRDG